MTAIDWNPPFQMTPEEFDRRGINRRRRRNRPTAADWLVSFTGTLAGVLIWTFIVFAVVWGVMR